MDQQLLVYSNKYVSPLDMVKMVLLTVASTESLECITGKIIQSNAKSVLLIHGLLSEHCNFAFGHEVAECTYGSFTCDSSIFWCFFAKSDYRA